MKFIPLTVTVAGLLSGLLLPAPPAHAAETPSPGAPSLHDRLFPGLGNGGYDAQSYDVSYDFRPEDMKMAAETTMRAIATQTLSRFSLDSVGQTIKKVTVNGRPAKFRTDTEKEKLFITPDRAPRSGSQFTVVVKYTADRSNQAPSPVTGKGTYWAGTQGGGFAFLGQPDRAHLFFPSNDHPSDKAKLSFRVTVPKDYTAVANGVETKRSTHGGRTTYQFTTRDPVATHVAQLAVGKLATATATGPNGLPLRSAASEGKEEALRSAHERVNRQLEWWEGKIGRPFPFETYGLLGIPGGAALETQTLTIVSDNALDNPDTDPMLLHELVHQHFGDAVSVRTWSDMWLSEGHASYYQFLYSADRGEIDLDEYMAHIHRTDQTQRDESGPPARPKDSKFSTSVYDGGALALYALQRKIGPEKFKQVEQAFLDRYRNSSASTHDYIAVVNDITGQDLTGFLQDWLYGDTTPPLPPSQG